VTPSDIFSWAGPDVHQQSKRIGLEQKWFAVTGRVVAVKVEADGDLHVALTDATGDKPGTVVCEVPLKPQWCDIRETVFSWTPTRFPFQTSSAKRLKIANPPSSPLLGKRFGTSVTLPKHLRDVMEPARLRSIGSKRGYARRGSTCTSLPKETQIHHQILIV
jgi:hypothetical protein